jgi:hypothetical protein
MSVLARFGAWLVEPAAPETRPTFLDWGRPAPTEPEREAHLPSSPAAVHARPVVAVVGLAPGCGTTTLARALAATLARRDHGGTAIVASTRHSAGSNLSARSAARLAALIAAAGAPSRAAGHLCLTSGGDYGALAQLAPLVLDLPPDAPPDTAAAQLTILVAPGHSEPALAELASRTLAQGGREPLTVVTRATDPDRWQGRAFLLLPQSRIGARHAAAGWQPRAALGAAVQRLAGACEEAACE